MAVRHDCDVERGEEPGKLLVRHVAEARDDPCVVARRPDQRLAIGSQRARQQQTGGAPIRQWVGDGREGFDECESTLPTVERADQAHQDLARVVLGDVQPAPGRRTVSGLAERRS